MSTSGNVVQGRWAEQLRAVPAEVRAILEPIDDDLLRARPAPGEWSAIEVLGHLVDKLQVWRERVERVVRQERPFLPGYDQDAWVREHGYQAASGSELLAALAEAAERFAATAGALPTAVLTREGVHGETGPIAVEQCVTLPLESMTAHLAQMRAAIAAATARRSS